MIGVDKIPAIAEKLLQPAPYMFDNLSLPHLIGCVFFRFDELYDFLIHLSDTTLQTWIMHSDIRSTFPYAQSSAHFVVDSIKCFLVHATHWVVLLYGGRLWSPGLSFWRVILPHNGVFPHTTLSGPAAGFHGSSGLRLAARS